MKNQQQYPYPYNPYPPQPPIKRQKNVPTWTWVLIVLVIIGTIGAIGAYMSRKRSPNVSYVAGTGKSTTNTKVTTTTTQSEMRRLDSPSGKVKTKTTESKAEKRKKYMASCEEIAYEDIMRNPDKYKGKRLKIVGEISQYLEGGILMGDAFTLYEDYEFDFDKSFLTHRWVVRMTQPNENRILVDDLVEFYGTFAGLEKVTTVLGETKTEPYLDGEYYVILPKK